ncbi:hypothetical protein Tco_0859069 [Tanacetum coccineum]|uniref:Uncharacterized protein n=1 Tax=Tanacetum coccineum TaxID=301880 RepID=A0ABQ5BEA6_9ASTR
MSATRQAMSLAEIDQIVAQRVTDAIEAIAVYETKIRLAHDSMNQVVSQGTPVARNANNKRKWELITVRILKGNKTKVVKWIVGVPLLQQDKGPQWKIERLPLPVMSVENKGITRVIAQS